MPDNIQQLLEDILVAEVLILARQIEMEEKLRNPHAMLSGTESRAIQRIKDQRSTILQLLRG
jgi:hypothetical protein